MSERAEGNLCGGRALDFPHMISVEQDDDGWVVRVPEMVFIRALGPCSERDDVVAAYGVDSEGDYVFNVAIFATLNDAIAFAENRVAAIDAL